MRATSFLNGVFPLPIISVDLLAKVLALEGAASLRPGPITGATYELPGAVHKHHRLAAWAALAFQAALEFDEIFVAIRKSGYAPALKRTSLGHYTVKVGHGAEG